MAAPTVEDMRQTIAAIEYYGSISGAARAMGLARQTVQSRYKIAMIAARQGKLGTDAVIPGFEISRVSEGPRGKTIEQRPARGAAFQIPDGHAIKGVSAFVGADGRTIGQWIKTKEGEQDPAEIAKIVRQEFEGYKPAAPSIITERDLPERLAIYIIADAHLGLLTHAEEVGEDNNLEIGVDRLRRCMRDLVSETASCEKALVINLGDAFHANDHKNMTPTSGHILDVASRIRPTAKAAAGVFIECVDMALERHDNVIVKHLPGNHDITASIILDTAAHFHYLNEPRVSVNSDDQDYFFLRYGRNLTGWHHGHRLRKPEEMAMCMATECREDWGETDFHYFHHGHLHHQYVKEVGGVIVECHRTLSPPDAHHVGRYGAGRSMTSITLDKNGGEHSRRKVNLLPITRRAVVA
jgi:hypothetical protein